MRFDEFLKPRDEEDDSIYDVEDSEFFRWLQALALFEEVVKLLVFVIHQFVYHFIHWLLTYLRIHLSNGLHKLCFFL